MRLNRLTVFCLCATLLAMAAPTLAQEFRGRINGTVTDNTGAVLPGVTVTASSPALIQPQVQVTGADGSYRFLALSPGVYTIDFELTGFQNVKRQDVRVISNQTLTVDQQLNVATLQETVTVTGDSPIVDTSTTAMGTNFTKELLTEIPNARDIWAAMSQAPGLQMTAFDVGGSNTGNQSGFRSYGMDTQNQTRMEGIDTTEGTAANAGYFDFGSFEEFQVGGAGADSGAFAGGAVLSISVKSGGDRFSGTWYSDYVSESQLTDNVPDYLRQANTPDEDGFFSRLPTGLCFDRAGEQVCGGNAVKKQYDLNGDLGGPIVKQKAWFFTSWRLNDKYAYITGLGNTTEQSKLSNKYTFKGTFQVGRNNQIIGYLNKREKLQDKRGINLNTPLSAAYYQSSRNYPWKVEGTRVMGSRAFLDVLYGNWYNFFPLRPTRDYDLYDGPWTPPRQDTSSLIWSDTGGNNGYQDQKRYKPQFYTTLSYFKDGWKGSHDFRFGYDWKRDRRSLFNDQPFDIWYRDSTVAGVANTLTQVDIYNSSVTGINDVVYNAGWVNDVWKITNRLTLNWGLRFEAYRDEWPDQTHTPNGHPMLASWDPSFNPAERARYMNFVAPKDVTARTVASTNTISPKVGFAYDLTGDNRTVLKGFVGRSRWNSADTLADQENPVGLAALRYAFVACAAGQAVGCDLNGDRLVSSPQELGAFQSTQGGAGFVRVDRDLVRPHTDEISLNVERELASGLSGRVSYVYKNIRNLWGEIDVLRDANYTVPFTINDPGADRVVGTADDQQFQTQALAAGTPQDRVYTNSDENNADFQNVEFAFNRRFSGKWMMLASYGMTWSTMNHTAGSGRTFVYRPFDQMFGDAGVETTTLWNYKIVGRYVMPWDIGVSGSWKVQSGFNFGRTISVAMPVEGNRTIRVEPITNNRYPNVSILDFRLDKTVEFGRFGRVTPMLDVFNVLNTGVPTTVRTTNTATAPFQEVTAILNPRVIRFGFRYNF